METIVNYMLQSGLCLLLLYLFYVLVLRNQPSLRYNRLFLLLAPAVALAAPLLRIPLPFAGDLPIAAAIPTFQLQEIVVAGYDGAEKAAADSLPLGLVLTGLYTLIGLTLLSRLAWQLLRVHRLAATATPLDQYRSDATILQTEAHYPTFAFLNYVFLSRQAHLSEKEQNQVLAHELAHVRLRHTYDILYYEVLTALLWFNPLVWLLKEELRDVHEYQADARVLSDYQPQEYSSLLAKEVLYTTGIPVGSYFRKPLVFRRLHMLQQYGREENLLRPMLALPLLFIMLLAFSAGKVNADRAGTLPIAEPLETLSIPENSAPLSKAETGIGHTQTAAAKPADKAGEKVKPYTFVEQMPEFKGGEAEILRFLGTNIKYPKAAQEQGVEGLVVISFVVETDGSLQDITVLKTLHDELDQEALRVVGNMDGRWNAGKQNGTVVPVRYTLPIRFAIK